MLDVRKRPGSSQECGDTSAKVASGALLAVAPPVMAYIVQYLMCWMDAAGIPIMSDPHWVAVFRRLVANECLPRQPSGTCAILWAVPATKAVRLRWVVTLLRGPRVESTPRSLTSSEILCTRSGPAACLRCLLAVPLDASMTVLSLLTFIPLSSNAWHVPPVIDVGTELGGLSGFLPGRYAPVDVGVVVVGASFPFLKAGNPIVGWRFLWDFPGILVRRQPVVVRGGGTRYRGGPSIRGRVRRFAKKLFMLGVTRQKVLVPDVFIFVLLRDSLGTLAGGQPVVVRGDSTRYRGGPSVRIECTALIMFVVRGGFRFRPALGWGPTASWPTVRIASSHRQRFQWEGALRFVYCRSKVHMEEPIGEGTPCRDSMAGSNSRSQGAGPPDSPGSSVLVGSESDDAS
eukprot:16429134-Heterocapsa_arctica.AAC.2